MICFMMRWTKHRGTPRKDRPLDLAWPLLFSSGQARSGPPGADPARPAPVRPPDRSRKGCAGPREGAPPSREASLPFPEECPPSDMGIAPSLEGPANEAGADPSPATGSP